MWWGKSAPLSTIMPTAEGGSLAGGQRCGGGDGCTDQMRAPMVAYVPAPPISPTVSGE